MTLEQLQALREGLPVFGSGEPLPPFLSDYLAFYQLNFPASTSLQGVPLQHQIGTIASGPFTLCIQYWTQPNAEATLLLTHGLFDHVGLFDKPIRAALESGCNVIAFDFPGHGLSSGEPAVIDSFDHYSNAIADVLECVDIGEGPLWAMGQSTGGAALINFARLHDWPFKALVLLAPLVRPTHWPLISVAQRVVRLVRPSVPRGFKRNSSDEAFLQFIRRDPLQANGTSMRWLGALRKWLAAMEHRDLGVGSALVIQGDADTTVDWRYNLPVIDTLFPGTQVEYLEGAGHQLANEIASYRDRYQALIRHYLIAQGVLQNH